MQFFFFLEFLKFHDPVKSTRDLQSTVGVVVVVPVAIITTVDVNY